VSSRGAACVNAPPQRKISLVRAGRGPAHSQTHKLGCGCRRQNTTARAVRRCQDQPAGSPDSGRSPERRSVFSPNSWPAIRSPSRRPDLFPLAISSRFPARASDPCLLRFSRFPAQARPPPAYKPVPGAKKTRFPRSTSVRGSRARCSLIEKMTAFQFILPPGTGFCWLLRLPLQERPPHAH
jgi:hypothetical protein